jgi:flagellar protein FliS
MNEMEEPMTYRRTIGCYQKTNVATSGKMDLVILCYETVIQNLHASRRFIEDGKYEKKAKVLQKAMDILNELQSCLNFEKGGQIAKNLDAIYTYITRRLLEGDVNNDLTAYDESIRILVELKNGWDGIASENADPAKRIRTPNTPLKPRLASVAA